MKNAQINKNTKPAFDLNDQPMAHLYPFNCGSDSFLGRFTA
jgi:hypothetical protein